MLPVTMVIRKNARARCQTNGFDWPAPLSISFLHVTSTGQTASQNNDPSQLRFPDMGQQVDISVTTSLDEKFATVAIICRSASISKIMDAGQIVLSHNSLRFPWNGEERITCVCSGPISGKATQRSARRCAKLRLRCPFNDNRFLKPAALDDLFDASSQSPQRSRAHRLPCCRNARRGRRSLVAARVRVAFIPGGRAFDPEGATARYEASVENPRLFTL